MKKPRAHPYYLQVCWPIHIHSYCKITYCNIKEVYPTGLFGEQCITPIHNDDLALNHAGSWSA